jgi:hypothetical protein
MRIAALSWTLLCSALLCCAVLCSALLCFVLQWCIKAKVTRKGLMRSFSARGGGGGDTKVFDVDLADAMVGGLESLRYTAKPFC